MQENLDWGIHIDYVGDKVSRATAILARLKYYIPKHALKLIFNSLCLSHMTYALSVWGASSTGRLNKIYKQGLRHVCKTKYNAHTEPLLIKENMIKFEDMFKLSCIKLMHKNIIILYIAIIYLK